MAGVVADGEHFVAERRNKQQIHIGKKARHLLADFAAETIGLNKIHGRKKTRLAEKVGPGVVCLHFQLIDAVGERELLERGGTFGEEIDIERAVRPIRKKDFDGAHAKFLDRFESSAVDVRGGRLLHPVWKGTDAKAFYGCTGIEVEVARDARNVARVGAGDGLQNEHGVFDGASHGAELVERPAERHGSGARDAAVGGTKAGDAASHAGADDAAAGFAADGEADKAGGGGCARTGARARRTFFEKPRIHGLATEPNVIEDRKSTRLNSSHGYISYAVFCLKKKQTIHTPRWRAPAFNLPGLAAPHTGSLFTRETLHSPHTNRHDCILTVTDASHLYSPA